MLRPCVGALAVAAALYGGERWHLLLATGRAGPLVAAAAGCSTALGQKWALSRTGCYDRDDSDCESECACCCLWRCQYWPGSSASSAALACHRKSGTAALA